MSACAASTWRCADLADARLTGVFHDDRTIWPEGFTPPHRTPNSRTRVRSSVPHPPDGRVGGPVAAVAVGGDEAIAAENLGVNQLDRADSVALRGSTHWTR